MENLHTMNLDTNTQNLMKFRREVSSISAASRPIDHYLIDTENMAREWVELMDGRGNAIYHIFYTEKSAAIPIECIERMMAKQESIQFVKCYTGANALDFQLVTQLGYMLATMPEDYYHIVSKDTGYDAVVKFWAERGTKVDRSGQTAMNSTVTAGETGGIDLLCREAVAGLVAESEAGKIAEIIRTVTAKGLPDYKTAIHTQLVKEYAQARGSKLYHACKDIMEQAYLNPDMSWNAS